MNFKRLSLILLASVGVLSAHADLHQRSRGINVTPYKASGIYSVGEKVGWTVSFPDGSHDPNGVFSYTIKANNQVLLASGNLDLKTGKTTIEIVATEPEMLSMRIQMPIGQGYSFGAAVAPTKIRPDTPRPKDFDSFWKSEIARLEAIPANPVLTPADSGNPGVDYATIQMDHVNGTHVYGQIAKPAKPGKYPAILMLQWASPPYPLQRSWVVDRAKQGFLILDIEPHDVLPTADVAYYRNLPSSLKNYSSIGQDSRETSYFVEMYLRDYRALDYLTQRPD